MHAFVANVMALFRRVKTTSPYVNGMASVVCTTEDGWALWAFALPIASTSPFPNPWSANPVCNHNWYRWCPMHFFMKNVYNKHVCKNYPVGTVGAGQSRGDLAVSGSSSLSRSRPARCRAVEAALREPRRSPRFRPVETSRPSVGH